MSYTTFSQSLTPETLFLNEAQGVSIQRFDNPKYSQILKLLEVQLESVWHPNEVDMGHDRTNMPNLSEAEEHVVMSNIKRQILLDSIMGRAPTLVFGPAIGDPTLEVCVSWWASMEALHSFSYTHIIQQSFVNPTKTLDEVMDIQEIVDCKNSIIKYYDDCIDKVEKYYNGEATRLEAARAIWLALNTANALESIRFQLSFACSFVFGQNGKLPGLANIIKLINRDENYHVAITNNLLAILPVDDPDFAIVAKEEETKEKVKEVWRDAIMEEYAWGDYLFIKGDIFAFNKKIAMQYLRYIATARLQKNNLPSLEELCGLESVYENPIPWISNWNGERKDQVAPQEIEKTDYEKGIIDKTSDGYAKLANIPLFGTEG